MKMKLGGLLLAFSAPVGHCFTSSFSNNVYLRPRGLASFQTLKSKVSDGSNGWRAMSFLHPVRISRTVRTKDGSRLHMSEIGQNGKLKLAKPLSGVLFDMDGTLSDSESLHWRAYQRVFSRSVPDFPHNPITREFYNAKMGGRTKANALDGVLPQLSSEHRLRLCNELEQEFEVLAQTDLVCLPGVLKGDSQLLDWLEEGSIPAAIVTNAPATEMAFSLSRLGVSDRFHHKVTAAECSHAKPHPAPYLEGMRRLGVTAEEAVAFEDSLAGVHSATAAGLLTVGVTTSRGPEELLAAGAALVVPDMAHPSLWETLHAWRAGAAPGEPRPPR